MIPDSHHGLYTGINRLWFKPGTPANVSDGTLTVSADRVAVRWAFKDAPKEGELVLRGPGQACRGDFTDTFHAASGMVLHGRQDGKAVLLYTTFPAGEGLPDWGWRIALDWYDPDHFSFRMFVVKPDGQEQLSVELRGARQA